MNIESFRAFCLSLPGVQYDGVRPGYHMNKKHWISVYFNLDVPDRMIRGLVLQSYQEVVASLPKRLREALPAMHSTEAADQIRL